MRRTTERGKRKEDRKGSKAGNGACFAKSRQLFYGPEKEGGEGRGGINRVQTRRSSLQIKWMDVIRDQLDEVNG